jgi:hypothetical protein
VAEFSGGFPTVITYEYGGMTTGGYKSGIISINCDSTFQISSKDSISFSLTLDPMLEDGFYGNLSLSIDSSDSLLSLQFSGRGSVGGDGGLKGTVIFDSVPFSWLKPGYLQVPKAAYQCRQTWSGAVAGLSGAGMEEDGGGSGIDTTFDSLGIVILAPGVSFSDVQQITPTIPQSFTIAYESNGNYLNTTFPSMLSNGTIAILDLLGRTAAIFPVPIGTESLQLPMAALPPGCYFARLGDQAAKFVVPPR